MIHRDPIHSKSDNCLLLSHKIIVPARFEEFHSVGDMHWARRALLGGPTRALRRPLPKKLNYRIWLISWMVISHFLEGIVYVS